MRDGWFRIVKLKKIKDKYSLIKLSHELYEPYYLFDYFGIFFKIDLNQTNIKDQNLNYIRSFKIVYETYKFGNKINEANKIRELYINLTKRIDNEEYLNKVLELFNN